MMSATCTLPHKRCLAASISGGTRVLEARVNERYIYFLGELRTGSVFHNRVQDSRYSVLRTLSAKPWIGGIVGVVTMNSGRVRN